MPCAHAARGVAAGVDCSGEQTMTDDTDRDIQSHLRSARSLVARALESLAAATDEACAACGDCVLLNSIENARQHARQALAIVERRCRDAQ